MEKQDNNRKIKIVLLDIFPSIEDLETSQNELIIIFQDNNNFYLVNKLLKEQTEVNFTTELSSIIISLIKKDYILATSIFNIKQGEQWLTFTYENQKKNEKTNLALILMNCIKIKLICEVTMLNSENNSNNIINDNQNKKYYLNKKIDKYIGSPCKIRFITRKEGDSKDISKDFSKDYFNSFSIEEIRRSSMLVEKRKAKKIDFKNLRALIQSPNKKQIINMDGIINSTNLKSNRNSIKKETELKKFKTKKLINPLNSLNSEKNNNKHTNFLSTMIKSQKTFEPLNKNSSRKNLSSRSNKNLNLIKKNAPSINSSRNFLREDKNNHTINTSCGIRNKNKNKNNKKEILNNNSKRNIPKNTMQNFYSNITLRKKPSKYSLTDNSFNIQEEKNKKIKNVNNKNKNIEINGPFSSRRLKNSLVKKNVEISKSSICNKSTENYRKKEQIITENKANKTYNYNSDNDSDFYSEIPDDDKKLDSNFFKLKEDYILLYNEEYLQNIQEDLLKLEIELFVEKMVALIYEYHNEIQTFISENKILESDLNANMKKYFGINKLVNKLRIIKRETKNKKYNKNKNHIDKLNCNNLNLNKNEIDIFKLLIPTKNNNKYNSICQKEMIKNIISIVLNKIENRQLIMNQNKKFKNWIEKNYDLKIYRGLLKTRVRAIPKIKHKQDNSSQICNKSATIIKDNDKNIHYSSHSHDAKKEVDTYVKKTIISPIYPQKYYYRRKNYK